MMHPEFELSGISKGLFKEEFMSWNLATSMVVVMFIMFLGDFATTKSKGWIPSLLVISILFVAGFWTFFPKDILEISMMNKLRDIMLLVVLIHVGAMFDIKQLRKDAAAVITTLAAIIGIAVFAGGIGALLFGWRSAIVAIPPLAGGGMANIIMSQAANDAGFPELAMMSTIIFTVQGFLGFPATIFFIKKEAQHLIDGYRSGNVITVKKENESQEQQRRTFNALIPEKYKAPSYYFLKLVVLAVIAQLLGLVVGKWFNYTILSLIVGFFAGHFGFLEKDPIGKARSFGILQLGLISSMMGSFANSTPSQIFALILPVVVFMLLSTVGILLLSMVTGKLLGYSPSMSAAVGLNCYLGFPYNFQLTNEGIAAVVNTEEEREYLVNLIMPKMIIGGSLLFRLFLLLSRDISGLYFKFIHHRLEFVR
jgi:hypothetical protein